MTGRPTLRPSTSRDKDLPVHTTRRVPVRAPRAATIALLTSTAVLTFGVSVREIFQIYAAFGA
ncbi:hypothetical protein ACFXAF_34425 [Kitasatospora sp. NPDC059463]|uniref:hypothetical protein n=1 Tax=unclassified Kitasatospora TaxID=2633591 RepID=UPI0036BC40AD